MASPPDTQDNAAQIAYWNDRAAVTWTAFQERLDGLFEPLMARALDAAAPAAGEHVVDIGCGCGASVLALADRVGPTGRVLALDVSQPMAARARERIAKAGLANAQVVVSDASTYTFPQADADLLFSRFGVMFFADPVGAFANLHRAMKTGGRLLCVAWRPIEDNPWFTVPFQAARQLLPAQPATDPDAPGPFALAGHDRTLARLTQAGWHNVTLTRHDVPMHIAAAGQIDQAADFATSVGPLARALTDEGPETRERVRLAVAETFKGLDGPDGIVLSGSVWLISARA
jgi:SAM-dependent methyltransferase